MLQHLAQRILQRGHMPHVGGDAFEPFLGQLQAVVERVAFLHASQVLGILFEQHVFLLHDGLGHGFQYVVLTLVADEGQLLAGSLHAFKLFS